jgi:tetratricopeptide (TPR) repeat protein
MKKLLVLILISASISAFSAPRLFTQGENARKEGKLSLARKYYFKFFTRNPENSLAPVAMYRYALSDLPYSEAVAYLKRIIKSYPSYSGKVEVMDKLAMLHYLKDKFTECIRVLDDVIKTRGVKKDALLRAYYYVGKSYLMLGRTRKALLFFTKVVNEDPSAYSILASLEIGETYFKAKMYAKAQIIYERIVRAYPESEAELKAVYRLGQIYTKKGEIKKAKAAYNYIIQSYPSSIEASFAKKKLLSLEGVREHRRTSAAADEQREEIGQRENSSSETTQREPVLTEAENQSKLTLHIGFYRNARYAKLIAGKLKSKGFSVILSRKKIKNKVYTLVRVGNFDTKAKAKQKASEIWKLFKLKARIINRT